MTLASRHCKLAGQILVCPWTSGLPDHVSAHVAPALFILGGADAISAKAPAYSKVLKKAGMSVTVKTYPGGKHPFLATPYPECGAHWSKKEIHTFITPNQKELAIQAENDIKAWIGQL